MKEKPNDPTVNAKLLNFYIDNGRFREAYDQAFKRKIGFVPNLFWYQSCVQICKVNSTLNCFSFLLSPITVILMNRVKS